MFNRFMQWFVPKLEAYLRKKGRYINITGLQDKSDVYLVRYFLFRSPLFSIYIHRFLRSDRDDPHDHPFAFLSYVVKGGYTELTYKKHKWYRGLFCSASYRDAGTWAYRPAKAIHMVKLDKELAFPQIDDATLTIIFRGPEVREWGFWKFTHTDSPEWVVWYEYLKVPKSDIRE